MAKFRKRQSIVDAVQWWPGREVDGVIERPARDVPSRAGGIAFTMPPRFVLETPDGDVYIESGDWVVTDEDGRRAVCPDARFQATYEPAN